MKRCQYLPPRSACTDGKIVARLRTLRVLITSAPAAGSADVASDEVELDRIATGGARSC
jgi:hypothetical protein